MSEIGINIQEILEQNKKDIANAAIKQIKESIASNIAYGTNREINDAISNFVKKEIMPEVNAYLAENRDALIDSYVKVVAEALGLVGEHMLTNAQKNMASSYNANEIAKKLFGW